MLTCEILLRRTISVCFPLLSPVCDDGLSTYPVFANTSQCVLIPAKEMVAAATVSAGGLVFTTPAGGGTNTNQSLHLDFPHTYLGLFKSEQGTST